MNDVALTNVLQTCFHDHFAGKAEYQYSCQAVAIFTARPCPSDYMFTIDELKEDERVGQNQASFKVL